MKTIHILKIDWHKENDKWVPGTDRLVFTEKSQMDAWLADHRKEHPALSEKDYKTSTHELKDNEHFYRVYISNNDLVSDHDAILTAARNETEARRTGNRYIRAWSLDGQTVRKIEKLI